MVLKLFKKTKTRRQRLANRLPDTGNQEQLSFRRNTTLSKRYRAIDNTDSTRLHIHRLSHQRRKVFMIFSSIVILICLVFLLIINFTARPVVVSNYSIAGGFKTIEYEKTIQSYLDNQPISRLTFLLNIDSLVDYVTYQLPEVESIKLLGPGSLGETRFLVKLRQSVASWSIDNKKYYVDSNGTTFDKNYYDEPTVNIIDNTGAPIEAGSTMVSRRLLSFVGRTVASSRGAGYLVTEVILPDNTMRQIDIKIADIKPYIKLSIDRPIGEQIEDMSRALAYFRTNNLEPDYIDIRVSNKAYYQ